MNSVASLEMFEEENAKSREILSGDLLKIYIEHRIRMAKVNKLIDGLSNFDKSLDPEVK